MNNVEVAKLTTYIEENLRSSPRAGLPFVDTRHYRNRLLSKQNHVVFGRRGAGKTTLVSSISDSTDHIHVYINAEDYKDITFPNIIIQVLVELLAQLDRVARKVDLHVQQRLVRWKLLRNMRKKLKTLSCYLHEPDIETRQESTTDSSERQLGSSATLGRFGLLGHFTRRRAREVTRSISIDKLKYLRLELPSYKQLLNELDTYFGGKAIYLIIDDFYFVRKEVQPELIDYLHRLTKGTSLFLKLATIKHRTKLFTRSGNQYVGVERDHDIFEVDMDYTLDNTGDLQGFMLQLLENAVSQSGAAISVGDLFAGGGFSQLCLASGGVPRDFLSLFVDAANKATTRAKPIGKVLVNEVAIDNFGSKKESMRKDSGSEDAVLEETLNRIKTYVYDEKRTNAFLVSKDDLEACPHARQAIRELVDLRLIHLVDPNTSKAPSDGRRYEAYVLDISLYDNPRPRNFNPVDPGHRDDRARRDELRASPVLQLGSLEEVAEKEDHLLLSEE